MECNLPVTRFSESPCWYPCLIQMLCLRRPSTPVLQVSCGILTIRLHPPLRCRQTLCSIAHIDEKNEAIKHLEDELHVRGVAGAEERVEGAGIQGERARAGIRQEVGHKHKSLTAPEVNMETRRGGGEEDETALRTRRHVLPLNSSSGRQLVASLSGLRSELQCFTTEVS